MAQPLGRIAFTVCPHQMNKAYYYCYYYYYYYYYYYCYYYAPINVIPGGRGVDKAFMPEGVAFDFMDSPQGVDI